MIDVSEKVVLLLMLLLLLLPWFSVKAGKGEQEKGLSVSPFPSVCASVCFPAPDDEPPATRQRASRALPLEDPFFLSFFPCKVGKPALH